MLILPQMIKVVSVQDDGQIWTVIQSSNGKSPLYTIIHQINGNTATVSNKKSSEVNEYFKHDITTFFNE